MLSDASEESSIDPFIACWLGRRLDLPGLAARGWDELSPEDAVQSFPGFPETIRNLLFVHRTPDDVSVPTPESSRYFSGRDWWIGRTDPGSPNGLVVAAKGGHNDVGSFVFHHRQESLLTDLGRPAYDNEYWITRYEFLSARALGHSVPYVNGVEQAAGREYAAAVVDRPSGDDPDTFALELAGSYPDEAGLDSLRRTFTLDRSEAGSLTVRDEARFVEAGSSRRDSCRTTRSKETASDSW